MKEIVFASTNNSKIEEFKKFLPDYKILSLLDFPMIDEVDETGLSYGENAYLKAMAFYDKFNIPVVSDDSGLEIHSLFGTKYGEDMAVPGIYSARYASFPQDSDKNNKEILKQLDEYNFDLSNPDTSVKRSCHYVSTLCYLDVSGNPHYFTGKLFGVFGDKPSGSNGWAYDLYFHPLINGQVSEKTYADLSHNERSEIGHRAKSIKKLQSFLENN